jgi:hypothetical protein
MGLAVTANAEVARDSKMPMVEVQLAVITALEFRCVFRALAEVSIVW